MENYIKVLEKYISKIANLNAISSRLIVDSIQHEIRDDYLYHENDPYFRKRPADLVDKTFLAINKDVFAVLMDEKTSHTIKELLILASKNESYFHFLRPMPMKTLVKFILSIKNDQLIEVTKLRKIIANHNQNNQKRIYVSQLKSLCDHYVSDIVYSYFEFKNQIENQEYAKKIFVSIQQKTKDFVENATSQIHLIENDDLSENWRNIDNTFQDFLKFNITQ